MTLMKRAIWYGRAESHSVTVPQKCGFPSGTLSPMPNMDDDVFPLPFPTSAKANIKVHFHFSSQRIGGKSLYIKSPYLL